MNSPLRHFLRCAALSALAFPAALWSADNVTIQNTTYTTGQTPTVEAEDTITASPNVVVNNGANVSFRAGEHVSLGVGFKVDAGGLFRIGIGQSLPYVVGFETSENYSVGSIGGQKGWGLLQGAANVASTDAYSGSHGLALLSGGIPAAAQQSFLVSASPSITFVDLYAKPVAASTAVASSVVQTESAQIGFQIASGQGEVYLFDGVGANQWVATGLRFAINGSNQATSWLRLTLRADYTHKKWDAYVNGQLADYDVAFATNSETYFRVLTLLGITSATAYFDSLSVQSTNPLFADTDKDGMSDAWETTHGLNNALDDRNSDKDSDGKTNIEENFLGTSASNADLTAPTAPTTLFIMSTAPTSLGVSWSGAADTGAGSPGVAGYHVYRDGQKVNSTLVTAVSFTDTGLTAGTSYTYTIRTVDLAGNVSAASSGLAITTAISSTSGSFELFTPLP